MIILFSLKQDMKSKTANFILQFNAKKVRRSVNNTN